VLTTQSKDRLLPVTNYTLDHLGAMSRADFIHHFPQTNQRWIDAGYLVNANKLMMAIIFATAKLDWAIDDSRGPREVWYNPIKPIVMRALGLRANRNDGPFEKLLSKLVKKGKLSYADLGIVDFRTMRETYEEINKGKCWQNILLFVEKDSAFIHLLPLKRLLNITIMSGAGWSNTSGIEAQLVELQGRGVTEIEVFTMTDYDPFGFAIDREFVDKCAMMGFTVGFHERIGIGVEHTTPELLEVQKYPIEPNKKLTVNGISFNSNEWLAEKGIDGQYGIEIEAVSGQLGGHQKLREIVLNELLEYLVEYDRIWEITESHWDGMPRRVVNHYLDQKSRTDWTNYPVVDNLSNYYEPEEYDRVKKNLLSQKEEATTEEQSILEEAEGELSSYEAGRDRVRANIYAKYETKIKQEYEKHIAPLEVLRSVEYDSNDEHYRGEIEWWLAEVEKWENIIEDIEAPYDQAESQLDTDYHKSRSLYAQAIFQWLSDNIQQYIDIAPETEPLSFGLMNGCIKKALEDNEKIGALIDKAHYWDKKRVYEYIGTDIDENGTIQMHIKDILRSLIKDALSDAREEAIQ